MNYPSMTAAIGRSYGLNAAEIGAVWDEFSRMAPAWDPQEELADFELAARIAGVTLPNGSAFPTPEPAPFDVEVERQRMRELRASIDALRV